MTFATLTAALDAHALGQPERQVFRFLATGDDETASLSFAELQRQAQQLAGRLRAHAEPGDRLLLLHPSGLDFVVAFFACLYARLVAVPVQAPRRAQSLDKLLAIAADCDARVMLADAATCAGLAERAAALPALAAMAVLDSLALLDEEAPPAMAVTLSPPQPDDLAFLQYTSGSTGRPKGVCIAHRQIVANSDMITRGFGHGHDTLIVSWLPMFHDMGLIGGVIQPVYTGFEAVLMPPAAFIQKPMRWIKVMSRYRATHTGAPNFAYDLCVQRYRESELADADLSAWRVAFNGAEPVRHATLERFAERFAPHGFERRAFLPCYGMAEATLLVSGGPPQQGASALQVDASACEQGRVQPAGDPSSSLAIVACGSLPAGCGSEVSIVDPDSGQPCEPGRIGEICIRGPHLMAGYWQNSGQGHGPAPLGEHGWLHPQSRQTYFRTGDLGFLRDGQVFVCGRLKDMIILKGRNLFPHDIEALVEASHGAFEPNASAAFTIEAEQEERLIVLQEIKREFRHRVDAHELRALTRSALSREFDVSLHDMVLVPALSLPKTSSGKIQRRSCRALYLAGELAPRPAAA